MVDPKRYEMNWSEVDVSKVKTAFKTADISVLDAAKLRVMSTLLKKTLSVQTALYVYVSRNWDEALQRLEVEAKLLGTSPEALFNSIVNDMPPPDR
jgi:hypothetical protein